jgi:hypothetical protein
MTYTLSGPIFAIAQREAVEFDNGVAFAADPDFLLKMETADDERGFALLLFTNGEKAAAFLAWKKDPALVAAVFRGPPQLVACVRLRELVLVDHVPGGHYGYLVEREAFIADLQRWVADLDADG